MGREAECICEWAAKSATVKALLESNELILRGAIHHKVPFSKMQKVRVQEDRLRFRYQGEDVALTLGDVKASKWCQVIQAPPVTLTKKLGITPESFVWSLGVVEAVELKNALATAKELRSTHVDLVVACVDSMDALAKVFEKTCAAVGKGVPLWIVYRKGKGQAVSESEIREAARAIGLIDSKVASVSTTHTGLRFVIRK